MTRKGGKRSREERLARSPRGAADPSGRTPRAGKKVEPASRTGKAQPSVPIPTGRPSRLLDTRIISACACSHADRYCGDCLDQLSSEPRPPAIDALCQGSESGPRPKPPDGCIDRVYVWHRFPTGDSGPNHNYEIFWGERSEPRTQVRGPLRPFEDRHASTAAYIDTMQPRCVELPRVLKPTPHSECRATPKGRMTTSMPW
jgi:hypothetical protein